MRRAQSVAPFGPGKRYRHIHAYLDRILKLYALLTVNGAGQPPVPTRENHLIHEATFQFFTVR
jgi:hypothetical protein